jgi:hypothetical protein
MPPRLPAPLPPYTIASVLMTDAGGATAEEAAVHVVEENDYDIRSE